MTMHHPNVLLEGESRVTAGIRDSWNRFGVYFTESPCDQVAPAVVEADGEDLVVAECAWATDLDERGWWITITPPLYLPEIEAVLTYGPYITEADALGTVASVMTTALALAREAQGD